jgi:hypothetical protein
MIKDKTYTIEFLLSIGLAAILIVFINPFNLFISLNMWMMLLTVFIVLFVIFSILVLNVKPMDEREEQHKYISSRISFLAGSSILTIGIAYQSFAGTFDYWLALSLLAMLGAKMISLLYCRIRN